MLRDFNFFRNAGKNQDVEEIENVPLNPIDSASNPTSSDSSRAPLHAIPEPTQNPKPSTEQEVSTKTTKFERTPTKSKGKSSETANLHLRTPERQGNGNLGKNRFGFSSANESRDEGRSDMLSSFGLPNRHGSSLNLTPRINGVAGRANSTHSESTSTQSTPTKSVSKPPNPGFAPWSSSRNHGSARTGPYTALSRRFSVSGAQPCVVNTVEVPHFDLKEDSSFWMDHNVQVIIRVRPLNAFERNTHGYNRCVRQDSAQSITWVGQPETRFTFDHVACETVDQEMLFRMTALPMVENCLSGYNSCMFAYGQTGSGKTYTMLGEMDDLEFKPSPHRGMTPRIFEFLFARIRAEEESRKDEKLKYSCKCSFLEIHNEQVTDLLDPSSTNLLLREDVKKGVYVENLSEIEVHTVGDILRLLIQGSSNRKVAATKMNRESSRSHSVFTCIIESKWERNSTTNLRFARLNLVDLAGSERQKSSGAEGERLKEAANINKSLSALGHVIMLLVDIAHGKPRHVPYRDSRLTFLLQDSLGGNSKTMIIANISPSICCAAETLNTLKFAQRAKLIQNNAVVNEDSPEDIAALQHQIWILKEELSALKHQNISRTLAFDPSTTGRGQENIDSENGLDDQPKSNDLHGSESKGNVLVSSKQLKTLETMLAGALRREQMAETSIKQLEAETGQLNRLVSQREEDTRCTKMMLKFREDKIRRMEALLGNLKPVDAYLLEENTALTEEIQMLRAKIDKNPEVTRFAYENIRLLEQLRKYQDFYEEGEKEILLREISELRSQLIQYLDNCSQQVNHSKLVQDAANNSEAKESLHSELTSTLNELSQCRSKLKSCLESNAKLSREIEDLQALLRNKDSETYDEPKEFVNAVQEVKVTCPGVQSFDVVEEEKRRSKHGDMVVHEEDILNMELELDILKIFLKEERLARGKIEDDAKMDLKESQSVIEALESQQLLLIHGVDDLKRQNNHYLELLHKQELEFSSVKGQTCGQESVQSCLKKSETNESPLQMQLMRMQASLDKAKRLNRLYQSNHASQKSNEEEMEEIRKQAEAETAEVIVCLQEELSMLQHQVQESDIREREAGNKLHMLETKLSEVQENSDLILQDNEALHQIIQEKDEEIKSLTEDWELLSCEIEEALVEGHDALRRASDQLDSISSPISDKKGWISEQMNKIVRQISDKESTIDELNSCLKDANSRINDTEHMLMSLRGAAMVMNESHQRECYEKEKEVLQLRSELMTKTSAIAQLESKMRVGHDEMEKLSTCATAAFVIVNRLSELNSSRVDTLRLIDTACEEAQKQVLQLRSELMTKTSAIAQLESKMRVGHDEMEKLSTCATAAFVIVDRLSELNSSRVDTLRLIDTQLRDLQEVNQKKDVFISKQTTACEEAQKQVLQLRSELMTNTSAIAQLESKMRVGHDEMEKLSTCATAAFVIVDRLSELNSSRVDTLRLIDTQLRDLQEVNQNKDVFISKQTTACEEAQKQVEILGKELELSECNITMLNQQLDEQGRNISIIQKKLKENEEYAILKTQERLNDLKIGVSEVRSSMNQYTEGAGYHERDNIKTLSVEVIDGERAPVQTSKKIEKEHSKTLSSFHEEFEAAPSNSTVKGQNVDSKEVTLNLLRKEIESAIKSLNEVQSEMVRLSAEKEEICKSEKKSREGMETVKDQVLSLQAVLSDFETQCEGKVQALNHKLHNVETCSLEARSSWWQTKESLEFELEDAKVMSAQKTAEASRFLARFEEAQDTVKEADIMINGLMIANETMKLEIQVLTDERDSLKDEVQGLQCSNESKDQQCKNLENQFESDISELTSLIQGLEMFVSLTQDALKNSFMSLVQDFNFIKSQLQDTMNFMHSSLEEVWSDIFIKDCSLSVLHLCHMGVLVEAVTGLNTENGLLHHGVSESNDVISKLRERNMKSKEELEMCRVLKGKLLSDIKNNFDRISKREGETGELSIKLRSFEEKLLGLHRQEELMLERSNIMGSELAMLMNEFDQSNSEVMASLSKQEEVVDSQAEDFAIELYSKDLEGLILVSQMQQLAHHNAHLAKEQITYCSILDYLTKDMVSLRITADLREELLLESETEVEEAKESISKVMTQLQSLEADNKTLGQHLSMKEEENASLENALQHLECEKCTLLEAFQAKISELESSTSCMTVLKFQNCELEENISTLKSRVTLLEKDVQMKKAELDDFECSQLSTTKALCKKSQDLENYTTKLTTLQEENLILKDELQFLKQRSFQSLRTSSPHVAKCVSFMEAADLQSCRILQQLDGNIIRILDKMSQDTCLNQDIISDFLKEMEFVDHMAKEIVSENISLQEELFRKDEILNGLLFDLRLLQESAANSKDQKDEIEELASALESTEDELALRSREYDEAVTYGQILDAKLKEQGDIVLSLETDLEKANHSSKRLSHENMELRSHMEDIAEERDSMYRELIEKKSVIDSLENELLEMGNTLCQMNGLAESLKNNLDEVSSEKDRLEKEVVMLQEKIETEHALAEENEAIAAEAQQIAETKRIYAEEKEEEVKLLENSVHELDSTITVLEDKVDILKGEAERQRLQREELELEFHSLKNKMHNVENADTDVKRHFDEKARNLQEALKRIKILEKDLANKDTEIAQCKAHILELTVHAEAQASEYKHKFKELEAMVEQVKAEEVSNHERISVNKLEKNASKGKGSASPFKAKGSGSPFKPKGSGSPFKCIGLGYQLKSEKDEELNAERLRIEELEALAASRQKEIFMLNARLATAESMTHDVIRDLLGVKLDMSNYVTLLDKHQVQKITDKAQLDCVESDDHEVTKLKKQLNEFIEERQGWLEEIDRRQAELVAAQVALEKHRQQEQSFRTENEALKMELANHKKRQIELEGEMKKLSGQQNLHQRIHHHAKIKEENSVLTIQNEDLASRLRRAESYLSRIREELGHYRACSGRSPYVDFDEEQRLNDKLQETEREKLYLAHTLLGLCTSILKAAGITKPDFEVDLSMAEEALEHLENRVISLERQVKDLKVKNKIACERMRLAELMPPDSSPFSSRSEDNRQTPRSSSQAPFFSVLDR